MSESLDVAADSAADLIQEDQLERVREFTREPILLEGETIADLVPGTARRRAVDAAIDELDDGRETPSAEWRQKYSLLLGLERLLSTPSPFTSPTAPSSPSTRSTCSRERSRRSPPSSRSRSRRALERRRRAGARERRGDGRGDGAEARERRRRGGDREDEVVPEEEEPHDWEEPAEEELVEEAPRTPAPSRRFWFEHATGSGKTVAALGLHRGLADGRRPDPDPPPQPRRPVHRRDLRPRLQGPALARRCSTAPTTRTARSPSRRTSGSSATPTGSPTPTRS